MITIIAILFFVLVRSSGFYGFIIAFLTSFGIGAFSFFVIRPWAVEFPPECNTITDVVRLARPPQYPPQQCAPVSTDPKEIWKQLVGIITETLNVKESDITPSTHFADDLRAD